MKLECWQPTGSFKVRGALNRLATLSPAQKSRGVVAASAGNHALGVAFAAQALSNADLQVTLFVPETAPRAKIEKLRRFPVDVRIHGQTYDDAYAAARLHADATGAFPTCTRSRMHSRRQGKARLVSRFSMPYPK